MKAFIPAILIIVMGGMSVTAFSQKANASPDRDWRDRHDNRYEREHHDDYRRQRDERQEYRGQQWRQQFPRNERYQQRGNWQNGWRRDTVQPANGGDRNYYYHW